MLSYIYLFILRPNRLDIMAAESQNNPCKKSASCFFTQFSPVVQFLVSLVFNFDIQGLFQPHVRIPFSTCIGNMLQLIFLQSSTSQIITGIINFSHLRFTYKLYKNIVFFSFQLQSFNGCVPFPPGFPSVIMKIRFLCRAYVFLIFTVMNKDNF